MKQQDNTTGKENIINGASQPGEDENLPGYPHYPASEDVMNAGMKRLDADVDAIPGSVDLNGDAINHLPAVTIDPVIDPVSIDAETIGDNDITPDDLSALGSDEIANDLGEDDELKNRVNPVDMAASDLDIPGSELDDENENIGSEDEENNFYSLGGDNHDN